VTGHFLVVGRTDAPFRYRVEVVREGGGYCQRRVDVRQRREAGKESAGARGRGEEEEGPLVFTCVCSFKTGEASVRARSKRADLEREYAAVLAGRAPESWPEAPGIDSPL
jgi:hypothetical protein